MNIFFVGNCQVEYLAEFLTKMSKDTVNITAVKPVYLITEEEVHSLHENMTACDVLVCQPIGNEYRDNIGLGSQYLKGLLRSDAKFVMIPNLYFDAYFPTFGYLKDKDGEAIRGSDPIWEGNLPWGDYHDYLMFASIIAGANADEFCQKISFKGQAVYTEKCIKESLRKMEQRDLSCDVKGEHLLNKFNFYYGDFFSYNHPSNRLMIALAKEIAGFLEIKVNDFECKEQRLCQPHLPVYPLVEASAQVNLTQLIAVYDRYVSAYSGNTEYLKNNFVSTKFKLALDMLGE
ncbi:MAG: hypothetical protein HRT54_06705 [Colwellia sp.]|nr:hypothetical protein [Colwellia sp.]